MRKFQVTGMSCAACSTRVEKAVGSMEGVSSCSVSLLTNSMSVEGTASDTEIIKAVEQAGYGASAEDSKEKSISNSHHEDAFVDRETPVLKMPEGHGGAHQCDEMIDIEGFFEALRVIIHYVLACDEIINE